MVVIKQFFDLTGKHLFKDGSAISNGLNASALKEETLIVESIFNVVVMEHDASSMR